MNNHLRTATILTDMLENRFKILGFRFGLDPIIGLIPGFGDLVSFVLSAYIVWIGIQLRLPQDKITLMLGNILLDFMIGIIPVLGDVGDFVFKANSKNLEILRNHQRIIEA